MMPRNDEIWKIANGLLLIAFLNMVDLMITMHIIRNGIGEEANPISDFLIQNNLYEIGKIMTTLLLVGLSFSILKTKAYKGCMIKAVYITILFYTVIIIFNVVQIARCL